MSNGVSWLLLLILSVTFDMLHALTYRWSGRLRTYRSGRWLPARLPTDHPAPEIAP